MLVQQFAGLLAGFFYSVYASTFRYHVEFEDEQDRRLFFSDLFRRDPGPGNLIYALFHQDDLSCIPYFAGKNICVLISQSKDGQMLASAVEHMGYQTIRGSSHRGGVAGLLGAMRKVKEGHKFSIAVDGPRGPIYKVKDGITAVSNKARRPIVPVRGHPKNAYVFERSWNRATLPLPFSAVRIVIGKIDFYETSKLEEKLLSL